MFQISQLNVNPDKTGIDRYRMPPVQTQSRKNNKTYFTNINKVTKALDRTPEQLIRFIGLKLATRVDTTPNAMCVNGEYTTAKIQETVFQFIKQYVLCTVCKNPETMLFVSKSKKLKCGCKACGASKSIAHNSKFDKWLLGALAELSKNQKKQTHLSF